MKSKPCKSCYQEERDKNGKFVRIIRYRRAKILTKDGRLCGLCAKKVNDVS